MSVKTVQDVLDLIEEQEVQFIDLRFTDTHGKEQHVSIPYHQVTEDFFEEGDFSDKLNIDRLREDLPSRIKRVVDQTTVTQRMQIMRDLCTISKADGESTPEEREVLYTIADGLDVPRNFICQTMEHELEPD